MIENPRFLIIVTGWNCARYVKPCLDSIAAQTYPFYYVSALDDGSTDETWSELFNYRTPSGHSEFEVRRNLFNRGTVYARDLAIQKFISYCPGVNYEDDFDVIAMVDMDDTLLPNALELAAEQYRAGKWMTYGNYQFQDGTPLQMELEYSEEIHAARSYRQDPVWRCTHLRTFRKELYKQVNILSEPAQFISDPYPDVHLLFSMMEMCGKDRIGVIKKPIYVYHTDNPLSSLRRFGKDHIGYAKICALPPREKLSSL